jgi:hypothetical protein
VKNLSKTTKIDVEALKHAEKVGKSLPHLSQLYAVEARKLRSHVITHILEARAKANPEDEQNQIRWAFVLRFITFRQQDQQVSRISTLDAADALTSTSLISGALAKQKEIVERIQEEMKKQLEEAEEE